MGRFGRVGPRRPVIIRMFASILSAGMRRSSELIIYYFHEPLQKRNEPNVLEHWFQLMF